MKSIITILLLVFLSACAEINTKNNYARGIDYYIDDFPVLIEDITILSIKEINQKCDKHKPFNKRRSETVACAAINFDFKVCHIYLPNNYEEWMLEHERAHCNGGDHDNVLSEYFEKWKNSKT